ncbi:MAG: AMP-binding protein [Phycisphaeraceae bacterium]|nr:AMP-binding protein [Phycisphaeraceae bacterium]
MSVHWPILRSLARSPLRVRVIDEQRSWTGASMLYAAFRLADEIERRSTSDHVALLLPTAGVFPVAALASWILGRAVVPLNYLLARDELEYVVRHCDADTIVTVGPMLEFMGYEPGGAGILRLDDINFRQPPSPRWPESAGDSELAAILYTSGTSGNPKGVMLTHGNLSANIRQVVERIEFTPRDTLLGTLPLFHSFGFTVLTLVPLTVGCRIVYVPRFIPQRIVRTIREHRPTIMLGIATMFSALLKLRDAGAEDFASLRLVVAGGEALPDAIFEPFRERFGVTICEGYGLTETSPVTHCALPDDYVRGTVGRSFPSVETRIIDPETERHQPAGAPGEIRLKGPNVMGGYYKAPRETREAFDERGYFRTGDIGKVDESDRLAITGRLKEMLIIGGENVFPREIEAVLEEHEAVALAGVIGVPDPQRGEVPAAFVELAEDKSATADELRAWCRDRLAPFKTPKSVRIVEQLPRTATGKILRRGLKPLLEEGAGETGSPTTNAQT